MCNYHILTISGIYIYIYIYVYIYIYIYTLLRYHVPSGLAGCQVHQLMPGTDDGCVLPNANVTDITNSQAESHLKATRRVRGELLKVNTANWLAFLLKCKVFDKHNSPTRK